MASFLLAAFLAPACVPDDPPGKTGTGGVAGALPIPRWRSPPKAVPGAPGLTSARRAAGEALPTGPRAADDPLLTAPFSDGFDRAALGADWTATTLGWRLDNGRLCTEHAKNHPAWLRRRLPVNARVEFDATSMSPEGDIKAEFWGDGHSAADAVSYRDATSYLTIFGGWKNTFHVLARLDEHAPGRPEVRVDDDANDVRARRVVPNRAYHFKVIRDDGRTVHWYVDDVEILTYPDPEPLAGPGHDHFGFNDWDVHVCFDHLTVTPLP